MFLHSGKNGAHPDGSRRDVRPTCDVEQDPLHGITIFHRCSSDGGEKSTRIIDERQSIGETGGIVIQELARCSGGGLHGDRTDRDELPVDIGRLCGKLNRNVGRIIGNAHGQTWSSIGECSGRHSLASEHIGNTWLRIRSKNYASIRIPRSCRPPCKASKLECTPVFDGGCNGTWICDCF